MNTEEFVKFIYNEDGTIKNLYNILGISSKLSSEEIDIMNLEQNDGFYVTNKFDRQLAKGILSKSLFRKMYDDLLSENLTQSIINKMNDDELVNQENRRVELLLSKINNLYNYDRISRTDFYNKMNDGSYVSTRYYYDERWKILSDLSNANKDNFQLDILVIDDYYIHNIKNNDVNTIIVSKDMVDGLNVLNRTVNIYGQELRKTNIENVVLNNLKGITWVIELKKSKENNKIFYESSYHYREKNDSLFRYTCSYDNAECLCLAMFVKFSDEYFGVSVAQDLSDKIIYNEDGTMKEKEIEVNPSVGYIDNVNNVYFSCITKGREIYFDLLENDPDNAKTFIKLAFPAYYDEIIIEPYQKTKEYKRERGNVYYEHARLFNLHV